MTQPTAPAAPTASQATPTASSVPPTGRPEAARPVVPERFARHLEALPLRLRLIAILLVLLLAALTLTAAATAVLMRRDLVGRVDADLERAYPSVAQQALITIVRQQANRLPSGYAVIFYPSDGSNPVELDPTSESTTPDMPRALP